MAGHTKSQGTKSQGKRPHSALSQNANRFNRQVDRIPDYTLAGFQTKHRSPAFQKRPRNLSTLKAKIKHKLLTDTYLAPLLVMLCFIALYLIYPSPNNPMHKFIFLSYPENTTSSTPFTLKLYGKGINDIYFCIFYAFFFSFIREFLMQRVIRPIAIRSNIKSFSKQKRFMEQVYTCIYFSVFGPFGIYIMYNSKVWYFNTKEFWIDYPHFFITGPAKIHYLLEASYWLQQAVVLALRLEKPRKDFRELVLHHIVTILLIVLSYTFNFTVIGLCVFITMDVSDIFLAFSKAMNYLDHWLTVGAFITFVSVWVYLRHYISSIILWSVLYEMPKYGPWVYDPLHGKFKCPLAQAITFFLLFSLQLINLFWLFLILRIAYRLVTQGIRKDDRSDDDDDDDEYETDRDRSDPTDSETEYQIESKKQM